MSDSLWPCGLQHARFPCPFPSPGVCSDSCPLNRWCYLIISSCVVPFSCPQSFPASRSFPVSWLFASGGRSICFMVMPILYSNHACSEIHRICCLIILPSRAQGSMGFPDNSVDKESACNIGDLVSKPGLGRSPGEGKGYPLQYSGLENSLDCIVHRVTKSQTQLSDFYFHPVYRKIVLWLF